MAFTIAAAEPQVIVSSPYAKAIYQSHLRPLDERYALARHLWIKFFVKQYVADDRMLHTVKNVLTFE